MGGEVGEPASGHTPFKALICHSKLLVENLNASDRREAVCGEESHEVRAVPGAWDAPDTADGWTPRPGRAEVDMLFRRTWVLAPLPPRPRMRMQVCLQVYTAL